MVYASALNGYAGLSDDVRDGDMTPLFQTIVDHVPPPPVDVDGPFQMRVSTLSYDNYVGLIGIGRIQRGAVKPGQPVAVLDRDGKQRKGRILQVLGFMGLERVEVQQAQAGDIVALSGLDVLDISDTLCDPDKPEALPALSVDEPTMSMTFEVNKSPLAGRDGKFLTSRQIKERLDRELKHNVALRVEQLPDPDKFKVSGRGQLHLGILIENMRREGFELAVSRAQVITREVDGEKQEPWELVTVDVESEHQGGVIQALQERGASMLNMNPDSTGRVRLEFRMPARGLIGFQTEFLSMTSGTGLLYHLFEGFDTASAQDVGQRPKGVMISNGAGKTLAYALFNLQERGRLFVGHGETAYEGMIVGEHSRDNDLVVNPLKAKQLTNIRAAGTDENLILTPPVKFSLEQALEYINDDELVEVTPNHLRLRKRYLLEHERKRASREA